MLRTTNTAANAYRLSPLWLATIGVCWCFPCLAHAEPGPIRVQLKPQAVVAPRSSVVMLSDIAEISEVTLLQRRQLETLDIADFPANQSSLQIDASLVRFRLELASPRLAAFQVMGASQVAIHRSATATHDEHVQQVIQLALAEAWGVDPSAVRVKLLQPLEAELFAGVRSPDDLDVALLPQPRPGNNRVKLLIHEDGRLTKTDEILVCSQLFAEQAIAAHDLQRGQTLEPHMLTTHWQPVSRPDQMVSPSTLVGKQLNMPLRRGQPVHPRCLVSARPQTPQPVVKPRDRVRVVARKGNLTVTLVDAEVLQAGTVGDNIRVRNPETNKVITARVVSADELTIRL